MPVTTTTKPPALAYIDGVAALLYWKSPAQVKPYALPVAVVERNVATDGRVMCHVVAKPGQGAPDGVDDWVQRRASFDVGHRTCTNVIDGVRVVAAWKNPAAVKPDVVLAVKLAHQAGRGKDAMFHVVAPPSAQAPDGIDMWVPHC